jgi:hypothetical protein
MRGMAHFGRHKSIEHASPRHFFGVRGVDPAASALTTLTLLHFLNHALLSEELQSLSSRRW